MKNKRFILRYIQALNTSENKTGLLPHYTTDPKLIERITALEQGFPCYQVLVDEVTAEDDRVVVRGRFIGKNEGPLNGLPPTHKSFAVPFAIGYQVIQEKIVDHWLITDQLALLLQSI